MEWKQMIPLLEQISISKIAGIFTMQHCSVFPFFSSFLCFSEQLAHSVSFIFLLFYVIL